MTTARFAIEEIFQIAGRGTVVAIGETTTLPVGKALRATVFRPDGSQFTVHAFKEWLLLRHDPRPFGKEAYLLRDIEKAQVPEGSTIELEAI